MYGAGRGMNSWEDNMYNMAARSRRPGANRFDEYYRCYPMAMAPGAERPSLNYGSKIFLPPSALDKVSRLHVQWPLLMELVNGEKGKHSHSGVLEFTAEEGRAYLPHWQMQTLGLDVGDMIQVKTTSLELARLVKLQPQSVGFLDISDPRAVLENTFRNFATLTKGDVFSFEYNDEVYDVAVLEVKPETDKMGVSMIETDVSVDFAPPVGYVEPERRPRPAAGGSGTSTPRSTAGGRDSSTRGGRPAHGVAAGGLVHHQGTMAQAINYDALAGLPAEGDAAVSGLAGSSNFHGEGQRLKKAGAAAAKGGASTPIPAASTPGSGAATPPVPTTRRSRPNNALSGGGAPTAATPAPLPLRLPPTKLFFGYAVKPYKSLDDKVREAEEQAKRKPLFEGRGQTLRGAAAASSGGANKRKGGSGEGPDEAEPKAAPKKAGGAAAEPGPGQAKGTGPGGRRLDGRNGRD